jgi:hypothetical protein
LLFDLFLREIWLIFAREGFVGTVSFRADDLPDGLILRMRVQTHHEKNSACAVGQISGSFSRVLSR